MIRSQGGPSQRTASPSGRSQALKKTRGTRLQDLNRHDETRRRRNEARDMAFVRALYDDLYLLGVFVGDMATIEKYVYNKLGFSAPGYLSKPIPATEIAPLINGASTETYKVLSQLNVLERMDMWDALAIGDYIAFTNARYPGIRTTQEQRQRRLIVNVVGQQSAIKIVRALIPLFNDSTTERYFKEVKVFLSTEALPEDEVKNDKLVVYYDVAPVREDTADYIGDQLVAMIYSTIEHGDVDETITPFYSELIPAISWAEDPMDFVPAISELSFTQSRAKAIALAIRTAESRWRTTGATIDSAEDLMTLIRMAFEIFGIHPALPHRHDPSTAV
ncbi:hypothetical protein GCM10009555_023480 [Acrocarpospora macrocephala]|uniref:Uncharacterized protein n=1 Tax=Acrocarpospora macrocephala TaxID=150177 RepID=A0A5M3WUB8_9ACTN|nr:T3SS effector HopA1 family protein [Acrocarpospora macrocephala]GES12280.1 hypothetical protein Amac_058770 [Acrocarpospora macrocephala]